MAVVVFDIDDVEVQEVSRAEQAEGKLHKQYVEDKLMNSVISAEKKTIEHAELINEATNKGIGALTPELLYGSITSNYSIAKQLLGERLIRLITGCEPGYIEKNIRIPEFKKEILRAITEKVEQLQEEGLLDEEGMITQKGAELGAIILVKELDNYIAKDRIGQKTTKKTSHYGEKKEARQYRKGDRYRDINIKRSIHNAIKRKHGLLARQDLMTSERENKGRISIIFALDASASMKGKKLETCKKAGIALSYNAIADKDEVGLIVFGNEIKNMVRPTNDFTTLLNTIASIKASKQTDFAGMITKSAEMFTIGKSTKHLVILTDALATVGEKPEEETLKAVSSAREAGITISLVGIQLDKEGAKLAEKITRLGEGRLSLVKDLEEVGQIVLEDYYAERAC